MKLKQFVAVALVAAAIAGGSYSTASAKGSSSTPSLPPYTTTSGPCVLDNALNNIIIETPTTREMDVELVHTDLPGGAQVHVVRDKVTNIVYVSNVCLESGWTVSKYKIAGAWGKEQGIDITVAYNGVDAVRYRLLGEGIRFDYY